MTTTTYFLNYHCFHLSEMAMCRRNVRRTHRSSIPYVNRNTYYTASRMLCVLKFLPVGCECTHPRLSPISR